MLLSPDSSPEHVGDMLTSIAGQYDDIQARILKAATRHRKEVKRMWDDVLSIILDTE
jgi:hypothetical protein